MTWGSGRVWFLILVIGLGTYFIRLSFIYLFGRVETPEGLKRLLNYVPAAVLSALVWPALLVSQGHLNLGWGNERLWAGLAALLAAWKTGRILPTIVAGLAALWLIRWIGGGLAF
ncbi:MAG: AzlD domain-containing protein [Thermodesulfobacteriota bacterium]